jgi:hypothetical protein
LNNSFDRVLPLYLILFHLSVLPENSKQCYGFTRFAIELKFPIELNEIYFPITLLDAGQINQAEKEKVQRSRSATGLCPKWN